MMDQEPDVLTMWSLFYAMLYLCVRSMERIKQKWNVNTKEKTCLAGLVVLESEGEEW